MQLTVLPLISFTSNSLIHLFIFRENILIASLINTDIALKTLHCILNNDVISGLREFPFREFIFIFENLTYKIGVD